MLRLYSTHGTSFTRSAMTFYSTALWQHENSQALSRSVSGPVHRFQISDFRFRIQDCRFGVSDVRCDLSGFGFQVSDLRFQISDLRCQLSGLQFQISGFRRKISEEGFQISDYGGMWDIRFGSSNFSFGGPLRFQTSAEGCQKRDFGYLGFEISDLGNRSDFRRQKKDSRREISHFRFQKHVGFHRDVGFQLLGVQISAWGNRWILTGGTAGGWQCIFFLLGEPMEVAGGTRGPDLVHRVLKITYKNPLDTWRYVQLGNKANVKLIQMQIER